MPIPYNKSTNFTQFQTLNPTSPLPAASVDAEFNAVETTVDSIVTDLGFIQRADRKLANRSVHYDALTTEVLALLNAGDWNLRGDWAASTAYALLDAVRFNGATYVALEAHTSDAAAFTNDQDKWIVVANTSVTTSNSVVQLFDGDGTATSFTLSTTYASADDIIVFVNGVYQRPSTDYTLTGTSLAFTGSYAPPSGTGNVAVIGASANLASVAANAANIATVAALSSEISATAGIAADITTTAGIAGDVTSVAGNATNITAVAANATNINAVAGNATNINAVAADIANVNTNAQNINSIVINASNIGSLNAVSANESNVNLLSTNIADIQAVAAALASSALTTIADYGFIVDTSTSTNDYGSVA